MRLLALLTAALLLAAASAAAATLKSGSSLSRDTVTLGDLFADLPDGVSPDKPVGRAPQPGRRLDFNAVQLTDIAAANDIGWTAPNRFVHVEIERAGHTIGREQIVTAL